jgi:glycosyltransferase involved in cell wall biosynthesis
MKKQYFVWFLIEKHKRSIEQILETDEDALRYSVRRFCSENNLIPVFLYHYDTDKIIVKDRIVFFPKNLKHFFKTLLLLKNAKIFYINTQGLKEFFLLLLAKASNPKIKTVYHFHGMFKIRQINFFKKIFYKFYLNLVDLVVNDVYSESKKVDIFLNKNKSGVFTYGSNLKPVKPKKHKKLTLIYVGRISREKNIEDIIFSIMPLGKKIKLIIVGGVEDQKYYNFLKEISNELDVEFTGFLNKKEIQEKFSESDFFINLRKDEVFGRVFIEALASGLPVIGHESSPGPREIIKNGKNGYLVESTEELTNLLQDLTLDEIRSMRKTCINSSKNYSFNSSYKKFKLLLDKLYK